MNRKTKQLLVRVGGFILLVALAMMLHIYKSSPTKETTTTTLPLDIIEVHFIDVGQGDSILIESENASMLIDAGENNQGSSVVDYLKSQNITKLDYLIGTHPHSDHIGGLDMIINTFPISTIMMPPVTHTTATFEDVLDAIENKGLRLTKPVVGTQYEIGPATFTILAPNSSEYSDLNNYSIVILLTYGTTSFIFTGDAESLSEGEMLSNGLDLSADVLKIGHHGSAYSSTDAFLDAVNPSYAVISVGANNEYGHPHAKTLQAIKDRNIKLYRTDKQGTIVFTTDGSTISVNATNYTITKEDLEN